VSKHLWRIEEIRVFYELFKFGEHVWFNNRKYYRTKFNDLTF
jgi:hypothetical protein